MKTLTATLLALMGLVVEAHASVTYWVSLDTSPLIGHPAGPFSVAFQLADGSGTGDGNNAVVVSNFQFAAGGPSGTPVVIGSTFGSLASTVSLTDSEPINIFYQTFTPGAILSFQIVTTTNTDTGGILDEFTFSILDNTLTPIPTMAGAPLDIFMSITISSKPIVQTYASDPSRNPAGGGGPISIPTPQGAAMSATQLNFGSETVGVTGPAKTARVTAVGSSGLSIADIAVTGKDPGDFAETNTCPIAPATLAPRAHCAITVTFTPLATGTRRAAVTINDVNGSTQSITLTGAGK